MVAGRARWCAPAVFFCCVLLCHIIGPALVAARSRKAGGGDGGAAIVDLAATADCVADDGTVVNDAGAATLTSTGNAYFSAADYNGAQACYLRALAKDPGNPTATLNAGLVKLMRKEYAAAQRTIEAALELSPDYAYAHLSLGNLHMMRAPPRYAESEAAYATAHALSPQMDKVGHSLGEAQVRLGEQVLREQRVAEAEAALRRVQRCARWLDI